MVKGGVSVVPERSVNSRGAASGKLREDKFKMVCTCSQRWSTCTYVTVQASSFFSVNPPCPEYHSGLRA